jgi:hypothetical protein
MLNRKEALLTHSLGPIPRTADPCLSISTYAKDDQLIRWITFLLLLLLLLTVFKA